MSEIRLPQKKYYRQRAHSNPLNDHDIEYPETPEEMDWAELYPTFFNGSKTVGEHNEELEKDPEHNYEKNKKVVEFADIGCGYGGLLVTLSPLYPDTLMLGMELRVKVSSYVMDRIKALRALHPGQYENIACIRTNAMRYLPNYFFAGQLKKMFFLYPDPHFKKAKHKWRIINSSLLTEYAFVLAVGGIVYTVTDVEDLHKWMEKHLEEHPLFERLSDEEVKADPVTEKILDCSEEGQKVTRNNGSKFMTVYKRVPDPYND